jgi:polynucleotide kinase-phosphatase
MMIRIPELSLVVLIGPSGSGKSTFARRHFKPTEVLSSDSFRGMVADDETDQSVSAAAFELLHMTCAKRLQLGRLTVIDATNVQVEARKPLVELARRYHVLPVALAFDLPEGLCQERNRQRPDRQFGPHVLRNHIHQLRRSLGRLRDEGFRHVHVLDSVEKIEMAEVVREPLHVNRKGERGPFDIIGDVHGCLDELKALLGKLGYTLTPAEEPDGRPTFDVQPPEGRKLIFVGDLVDRGPDTPGVLRLVMRMVDAGRALCVRGNHDDKLLRKLSGHDVSVSHGLAQSLAQLETEPPAFIERVRDFLDGLVMHYVLDGGKLVVAHAGLQAELQGRVSERVRAFALYGDTTGESDEFGLPVRLNWAMEYRGRATVVYGHTPVLNSEWVNRTICIDTGCVFGGALTALRYPEGALVAVPAARTYVEPKRPIRPTLTEAHLPAGGVVATPLTSQQAADDVLDISDVLGKRIVETRLVENIVVREGNAAAALEVMSRFAANPRWLIYLPPTMAPCETSKLPDYLEHPREAFDYFARQGVPRVICELKHMGSRAVVIVCRDEDTARRRFGVIGEGIGVCLTRTGRRFFNDQGMEAGFLAKVRDGLEEARFWERFGTEWVCLDGELMPWSAKAQDLLRRQYAATGAAGRAALAEVQAAFRQATLTEVGPIACRFAERSNAVSQFIEAYRRYCWPVRSVDDLRFAPFHLLATEDKVRTDRDHVWHMQTLAELEPHGGGILMGTPFEVIAVNDAASVARGIRWWEELTARGGEGMVVKPLDWTNRGGRGLVQPAIKVRGREYLRIIYGPEYTRPEHLDRLRRRGLGLKQSLAAREFALGIEALERFVGHEPLRRVHECCFAVLALESEPVDPRL